MLLQFTGRFRLHNNSNYNWLGGGEGGRWEILYWFFPLGSLVITSRLVSCVLDIVTLKSSSYRPSVRLRSLDMRQYQKRICRYKFSFKVSAYAGK